MSDVKSDPKIIVALDYDRIEDALALAKNLDPTYCRLKVGKELFTAVGPRAVEALQALGFELFLDLKFHDIPATVAKAVTAAANLGVWMVNVHASGGRRMMCAAREAIEGCKHKPLLIAVTVLTSMESADLEEVVGSPLATSDQVNRLAKLTLDCGLDGVVCSAQEASMLKSACGEPFKLVTPGIRPVGASANDQRRIVGPAEALQMGSDYLVIGRPISKADDPRQACLSIVESIREVIS